jgi:hypothetical protein
MLNTSSSFAKKACDNITSLLIIYYRGHVDCFSIPLSLLELQVIASYVLMWNLGSV